MDTILLSISYLALELAFLVLFCYYPSFITGALLGALLGHMAVMSAIFWTN